MGKVVLWALWFAWGAFIGSREGFEPVTCLIHVAAVLAGGGLGVLLFERNR